MIIVHTMGLDTGEAPLAPRVIYLRNNDGSVNLHINIPTAVYLSDPVALDPDQCRELAGWLVNLANHIDANRRGFDQPHPHNLAFDYTNPFHSAPLVTDAVEPQPIDGDWTDQRILSQL